MTDALLAALLVTIFIISHLIVWVSAESWYETSAEGGWRHVSNWGVVIVAASCATWCYGTLFVLVIAWLFSVTEAYIGLTPVWFASSVHWTIHTINRGAIESLYFGRGFSFLPVVCGLRVMALKSWALMYRGRHLVSPDGCCYDTFMRVYGLQLADTVESRAVRMLRTLYWVVYTSLLVVWPSALSGGLTTYKVFERARKEHVRAVAQELGATHLVKDIA